MFITLPRWKVYLYTLLKRWQLYNAINTNEYKWGFNPKQARLIGRMLIKYLPKEVMQKTKAVRYDLLVDAVREQMVIAEPDELELAMRLSIVKKINIGGLFMEIKQLKNFGKLVGLKMLEMNKMSEKELIDAICNEVDPSVQYPKELVAWYNDLPDEYFHAKESMTDKDGTVGKTEATDIDEIIEALNEAKKIADVKVILEDESLAELLAGFDATPYKLPSQLKKAVINHLEEIKQSSDKKEPSTMNQELIDAVLATENEDELGEVFNEYPDELENIEITETEDYSELKASILDQLGYEAPKEEKKAKKDKGEFEFDPSAFDPDEVYAHLETLKMSDLRKFAKAQLGLVIPIGKKVVDILELCQEKLLELAEGAVEGATGDEDIELTPELIEELAASNDVDSLLEVCAQLEIKPNILQKKSAISLKKLILTKIGEAKPTKEEKQPKGRGRGKLKSAAPETAETAESIYAMMEQMVLGGKKEPAIIKAVAPFYEEKGKSSLFIKKRVSQMVKIIKLDNDLE